MHYNKLTEVHEDALYSFSTLMSADVFEFPHDQPHRIHWVVTGRKRSQRVLSPDFVQNYDLINGEDVAFKMEMFELLIDEMFSYEEVLKLATIFNPLKHIISISIEKFTLPLTGFPEISPALGTFQNGMVGFDYVSLKHIIPADEIQELFQDRGIQILGFIKMNE